MNKLQQLAAASLTALTLSGSAEARSNPETVLTYCPTLKQGKTAVQFNDFSEKFAEEVTDALLSEPDEIKTAKRKIAEERFKGAEKAFSAENLARIEGVLIQIDNTALDDEQAIQASLLKLDEISKSLDGIADYISTMRSQTPISADNPVSRIIVQPVEEVTEESLSAEELKQLSAKYPECVENFWAFVGEKREMPSSGTKGQEAFKSFVSFKQADAAFQQASLAARDAVDSKKALPETKKPQVEKTPEMVLLTKLASERAKFEEIKAAIPGILELYARYIKEELQ